VTLKISLIEFLTSMNVMNLQLGFGCNFLIDDAKNTSTTNHFLFHFEMDAQ